jgi:hypothetical protein
MTFKSSIFFKIHSHNFAPFYETDDEDVYGGMS